MNHYNHRYSPSRSAKTGRKRKDCTIYEIDLLHALIGTISESDSFHSALRVVLEEVCKATCFSLAEAWIPNADGTKIEISPIWYSTDPSFRSFRKISETFTFPPKTGLPGRVWSSKKLEWIEDVTQDRNFLRASLIEETPFRTALAVPITLKKNTMAVLIFFANGIQPPNKSLMKLLNSLAIQLAWLIEYKQAEDALRKSIGMLEQALHGTVGALVTTLERRDPYTVNHEKRVAEIACAIGSIMGFTKERIDGIRIVSYLHDIGKIAVPAEILSKPGRINEFEFNIIKSHARVGYEILKSIDFPWPVAEAAYQHHERIDGSGYPLGLKNDQIITEAKILAVADTVEAMASHRPYRPALGLNKALEEIALNRETLYDAATVDACLRLFRSRKYRPKI